MAIADISGDTAPSAQSKTQDLKQRLDLAYEANARALELIKALRPYIDQSNDIEVPILLFNRLNQLCHAAYDAAGGAELQMPGNGVDELRRIVEVNELDAGASV